MSLLVTALLAAAPAAVPPVWGLAETALRETRSAALLADHAEKQGFRVERGVAGMPTAFVASYGQGPPVIAVLGECDALPGLSQKAVPERTAPARTRRAGRPSSTRSSSSVGAPPTPLPKAQ